MTETVLAELLEDVKLEIMIDLGTDEETNAIVTHYLEKAEAYACDYTKFDVLPDEFNIYLIELVVEALNKRGSEGISHDSVVGVSTTFAFNDMSEAVKSKFKGKINVNSLWGYR